MYCKSINYWNASESKNMKMKTQQQPIALYKLVKSTRRHNLTLDTKTGRKAGRSSARLTSARWRSPLCWHGRIVCINALFYTCWHYVYTTPRRPASLPLYPSRLFHYLPDCCSLVVVSCRDASSLLISSTRVTTTRRRHSASARQEVQVYDKTLV